MLFYILGILISVFVYYKLIKPCSYWADRKVPHVKSYPLVGSTVDIVLRRRHFAEIFSNIYKSFPKNRYVGMQQFLAPALLIRDPDLIKQIGIKHFDSFPDHNTLGSKSDLEPLMSRNLLALKGNEWRKMRATLSPAFTSAKIKTMYTLMADCAKDFAKFYRNEKSETTIEMKDILSRYTNDVIATTAFGIKVDSLREPDNQFFKMGKRITTFGSLELFKALLQYSFPKISKFFDLRVFPKDASDFFSSVFTETIAKREAEHIIRPDLINLLMEARKGKMKHETVPSAEKDGFAAVEESAIGKDESVMQTTMSEQDMLAQALIFFFAGFDTVSTAATFMAYELAIHPDIQKRLQNEIDAVKSQFGDKVPYETLLSMKYLDQVVSEVLRFWTPAFMTDRVCDKDFVIKAETPEESDLLVKKGMLMFIPVMAIQRDEQYYEDPDRFDPDRFSDENKAKIRQETYMPFGIGPRNCIGSRFALIEVKTLFFNLLASLDIVPVEKTVIPYKLDPKSMNMLPTQGVFLGFKPREETTL